LYCLFCIKTKRWRVSPTGSLAARWFLRGDVAEQGKVADAPALRSQEGTMAKTDTPQSDAPIVVDRRKLLAAAAAMTAVNTMPTMADAEAVPRPVQSSALPPGVQTPKVCAATARRLLEICRRNELRRAAQLPLLSIPKELRRMKQQEELEAFSWFEAAHGPAVWARVLEARRRAEGNPNWRPNWMDGIHYQNQVYAALRARFSAEREKA
jgi:hypothetical protein